MGCAGSYSNEHSGIPISDKEWKCSICQRTFIIGEMVK